MPTGTITVGDRRDGSNLETAAAEDYEVRYGGKKREAVVAGTGIVFRDLGLADSEDRKLRVQLAVRLNELIDEHRLSQAAVTKRFGVPQPHVSDLRNYKPSRFSSERLVRFITMLDPDVDIVISPRDSAHETGHVSVLFAV